jgi:hypothetical protein
MIVPQHALLVPVLLLASCAAPATSSPGSPTATLATVAAPTSTSAATASTSTPATTATAPAFAASQCTSATASTRQVIERYFSLSTSNSAQAVTDCFAKAWREKNATGVNVNAFADASALWSRAGPPTDLVITFLDAVNGCDRYFVAAKMASGFPIGQGGSEFITIGPESGTPRIFEVTTGLVNAQSATTTCK